MQCTILDLDILLKFYDENPRMWYWALQCVERGTIVCIEARISNTNKRPHRAWQLSNAELLHGPIEDALPFTPSCFSSGTFEVSRSNSNCSRLVFFRTRCRFFGKGKLHNAPREYKYLPKTPFFLKVGRSLFSTKSSVSQGCENNTLLVWSACPVILGSMSDFESTFSILFYTFGSDSFGRYSSPQ